MDLGVYETKVSPPAAGKKRITALDRLSFAGKQVIFLMESVFKWK
jgi:hypothetical protein